MRNTANKSGLNVSDGMAKILIKAMRDNPKATGYLMPTIEKDGTMKKVFIARDRILRLEYRVEALRRVEQMFATSDFDAITHPVSMRV